MEAKPKAAKTAGAKSKAAPGGVAKGSGRQRTYAAQHQGGRRLTPLPRVTAAVLANELPQRVRGHCGADAFLAGVESIAATVAHLHAARPHLTLAERRDRLVQVEQAAHAMQHTLAALANGSDAFDDLETQTKYVLRRNREASQGALGRPTVPALPSETPDAGALLQRIDADLAALRALCSYAADRLQADRNRPKGTERLLVEMLAHAHCAAFGRRPAPRGWFASFAKGVAAGVDPHLVIGHRVVADVIAALPK